MNDYYFKIDEMSNDKILTEIETLRKKQFNVKIETPIWYQIQDMIDFCTQEYHARVMSDRLKNEKSSDVMDQGLPTFNGDKTVEFRGNYDTDGFIFVKQDQALPLTVLALYPTIVTNDG